MRTASLPNRRERKIIEVTAKRMKEILANPPSQLKSI